MIREGVYSSAPCFDKPSQLKRPSLLVGSHAHAHTHTCFICCQRLMGETCSSKRRFVSVQETICRASSSATDARTINPGKQMRPILARLSKQVQGSFLMISWNISVGPVLQIKILSCFVSSKMSPRAWKLVIFDSVRGSKPVLRCNWKPGCYSRRLASRSLHSAGFFSPPRTSWSLLCFGQKGWFVCILHVVILFTPYLRSHKRGRQPASLWMCSRHGWVTAVQLAARIRTEAALGLQRTPMKMKVQSSAARIGSRLFPNTGVVTGLVWFEVLCERLSTGLGFEQSHPVHSG